MTGDLDEEHKEAVRRWLAQEKHRRWLLAALGKVGAVSPWFVGGLFYLLQGDFLGALKWWK